MMMEVETGRILKGNDPIEGNHFFLNHDYGRKGILLTLGGMAVFRGRYDTIPS